MSDAFLASGAGPRRAGQRSPPAPRGRNRGRYHGEGLDVANFLAKIRAVAALGRWNVEVFGTVGGAELVGLRRAPGSGSARRRIYLSAGVHGDEPAGPLALLELVRRGMWPPDVEVWVCPCLNPEGFRQNRRENAEGLDLNRDYRHLRSAEVRAHVAWLERQPAFDCSVCLHEDWEAGGFYLYELNPRKWTSAAEAVIERVQQSCPIDPAGVIDGREARGGIIRPSLDPALRPEWPEAFYLVQRKGCHSYTLEAPSDFELPVRVRALTDAVEVLVEFADDGGQRGRLDNAPVAGRL